VHHHLPGFVVLELPVTYCPPTGLHGMLRGDVAIAPQKFLVVQECQMSNHSCSEIAVHGHRASPPSNYNGAGAPSELIWAQQVPWTSQRGRRRCSSADSSTTARSETLPRLLESPAGRFLWDYPPAGAQSKELATPCRGRQRHQLSDLTARNSHSPVKEVPSIRDVTVPTGVFHRESSPLDIYTQSGDGDECRRERTQQDANIGVPRLGVKLNSEYVARWLDSVGTCIPSPALSKLRAHIVKHSIDAKLLEDVLDNCRFELLEVDNFTPVHMNRLRKAWYLDHPKPTEACMKIREETDHQIQAPAPSNMGVSTDIEGLKLVAVVLDRLSHWAGFDRESALEELRDVLSESVCEAVRSTLSQLTSANQETHRVDRSARLDTIASDDE